MKRAQPMESQSEVSEGTTIENETFDVTEFRKDDWKR